MLWIMIYLFDLCAPNNKKADTIMTLKGYCTSLKNENSGIIYVPSCHSKEVWLSSSNFGPYNKTQYSIGPHWISLYIIQWKKCISSNWITIHKHVYYTVFRDIRMSQGFDTDGRIMPYGLVRKWFKIFNLVSFYETKHP